MSWRRDVEALIEEKSLLKHPFYQAWTRGTLSREDLAEYARQYYQQEARFSRYVSAVHANCPDLAARQALVENLTHEEQGPENHPELWLRFAESVGASRRSVTAAVGHAKTQACVAEFDRLSRGSEWLAGLAALYAYESQQPRVARAKIDGLRERYGLSSPEALGFFQVHEKADAWHSESEWKILERHADTPAKRAQVLDAVGRACDALNGLLDGVCETRNICGPDWAANISQPAIA
ncbi:MAG: CADD family putative folate metabolism protein [Elusimicrobia bacterium]|nr:CADD family putative folate metabolism protein [Elusimicrobiota bacterium]